jgi:hypothetical protein
MAGIDDIIGEWVKQAEQSGELRRGRYWGKPFDLEDGMAQTPTRLRMAYRILKNAGYVPPEVELLRRLADLKDERDAERNPARRERLDRQVANLESKVATVLEKLRSGSP